ncbi:NAD(P)/FAD-dependent oxidoreductase [uncultured Paracoccus sp.]|uniref:NAD(P)/FAD-dependent oxidoreductase n=1 Tax=uncultured Paracoccus sp. TaxID=189685 RepID=UPI002637A565|nr:NAD(P)/FAD-dependent oxidoreductase [uncultured Paracoccus sp.]
MRESISLSRRQLLALSGAALLPAPMVMAQGRPRVVVIGGGAGGATVARYLAKDSGGAIEVVLVEPAHRYDSCFFSNIALGGFWEFSALGHGYDGLAGVQLVQDWATGVDRDARRVALGGGGSVSYDRLVIAPGIDFVEGAVPGWDVASQQAMPHAYKGGSQIRVLKAQIEAMREGGTFALIAPPNPYRCPPGPYERASMVAHLLTQSNPTAKILIVDPKESFAKQALFEEGWQNHYPGMITRIGPDFGADTVEVRPETMELVIDGEVEAVDVCNVIPAQQAGMIAAQAGLTDETGWAPVRPEDMRSRLDEAVTVLGDAAAQGDMPKSAFAANSQAKVVAHALRAELTGGTAPAPRYLNTCWSLIAAHDGVRVGATYAPAEGKITALDSFVSQPGESAERRRQTWLESVDWYRAISADIFGSSSS